MTRRSVFVILGKVVFSAAVLWLVLSKVDAPVVVQVLRGADPWLIALWFSLLPISVALSAWRWAILAPGLPFGVAHKYSWIGVFFGHVLPGSIAGDVAKGVSLAMKESGARAGLGTSIVVDKLIGLAALVVFFDAACVAVYVLRGEVSAHIRYLAGLALVLSAAGVLSAVAAYLAHRKGWLDTVKTGFVGRTLSAIDSATRLYRDTPSRVGSAFAISVLLHLLSIFAVYLSFRALGVPAGMLFAAIVYPVLSVILLVPISISGIGIRDATLALLFSMFGLSPESGVALSWLALLAVIPTVAIGGAVQIMEMYRKH